MLNRKFFYSTEYSEESFLDLFKRKSPEEKEKELDSLGRKIRRGFYINSDRLREQHDIVYSCLVKIKNSEDDWNEELLTDSLSTAIVAAQRLNELSLEIFQNAGVKPKKIKSLSSKEIDYIKVKLEKRNNRVFNFYYDEIVNAINWDNVRKVGSVKKLVDLFFTEIGSKKGDSAIAILIDALNIRE